MNAKHLLLIIALIGIVGLASAVTVNGCHKVFVTEKGPSGVMLPLGFEVFFPIAMSMQYYNYVSIFLIFLIGLAVGQRDEAVGALGCVGMGAFCCYVGWLNYAGAFSVVALCSVFAVLGYITQRNREKYGQRGQGSLVINIAVIIMIIQVAFAIVNAAAIFPIATQTTVTTTYANIDITKEITTLSNTGGALQTIVDIATVIGDIALSGFRVFVSIIGSLVYFRGALLTVMPWLTGAVWLDAITWGIQFFIWIVYALYIFNIGWKPGFETARV